MMDAIMIQAENEAEILVPVSLRDQLGQLRHFKMNCEVKYDGSYIRKSSSLSSELLNKKTDKNESIDPSRPNFNLKPKKSQSVSAPAPDFAFASAHHEAHRDKNKTNDCEGGGCIQILCYLRDDIEKIKEITEEKCMMRSSLFQDTFIRRVFHKMRTPLHVICNSLGVSEVTLEELSEVRYHAGVCVTSCITV